MANNPILISTAAATAGFAFLPVRMALYAKPSRMDDGLLSETAPEAETKPGNAERIRVLRGQIADLKKRLPKHSIPATMLLQLEDLEEELEKEFAKLV